MKNPARLILNPYLNLFEELAQISGERWVASDEVRSLRRKLVSAYAWAVPSQDAIEAIVALRVPLVEFGAGTGYWAFCLRQAGAVVDAYDVNPGAPPHWSRVEEGTPECVWGMTGGGESQALFLCWPPLGEPLAEKALGLYSGAVVIEVGEGPGGKTGSDRFHSALRQEWSLEREVELPRWPGASDSLRIWRR